MILPIKSEIKQFARLACVCPVALIIKKGWVHALNPDDVLPTDNLVGVYQVAPRFTEQQIRNHMYSDCRGVLGGVF